MTFCTSLNISLASFPGLKHQDAVLSALSQDHIDPFFGKLSHTNLQLVPQNFGGLCEEMALDLKRAHPDIQFRLHANVPLMGLSRKAYDLSNVNEMMPHFHKAAQVSKALKATGYSAHTGLRGVSTLDSSFEACRMLTDLFECPVGAEGQYPHPSADYVLSTWEEYAELLVADVYYVIDLSHLNIVAHRTGRKEINLVQELVNNPRCIEVHVSDNNGTGDHHQRCREQRWWHEALEWVSDKSCVFYEGNLLREIHTHQN